ncbi:MAG: tRNA (guanosine(37)-N1)-methyltransferase TrmD [Deltaproteobacteria bacterium]|nr:tRNA (guanosine(37)-N1)-methyltransferase TrmD [Deltaproteobacteria bacterium]MBW1951789.1 tRNA (guanosine(37)-N1)-methyltransferase TrmD [Deltaproteobacteria bacterium]MBW1985645.1 tRNA (guanosine(37)-N1)-methyltransferase TrmD [Deltaproteobacteria bacterium]MBW2134415.1 tRNA (guanosine(37)-N1)-methyltransferase TrmD [Deltaproteobacteria bacterium]
MQIDILTLFPEFFDSPLQQSMLKRAQHKGVVHFRVINLRDFALDRHQVTDDRPFGGGPGMVLKIEPLARAINWVRKQDAVVQVILLSPQGALFKQPLAATLARQQHLLLVCGHYEGVDDRVRYYIDEEISIGDYILTGGEIPALAVIDAVTRLLPGSLGDAESAAEESFQDSLLEYPHYTRPQFFNGHAVPEILLSGDHQRISRWRRQEALRRTWQRRPELLKTASLTPEDQHFLAKLTREAESGSEE